MPNERFTLGMALGGKAHVSLFVQSFRGHVMIVFVTVTSWLVLGFALNLIGVFDGDEDEDTSSAANAGAAVANLRSPQLAKNTFTVIGGTTEDGEAEASRMDAGVDLNGDPARLDKGASESNGEGTVMYISSEQGNMSAAQFDESMTGSILEKLKSDPSDEFLIQDDEFAPELEIFSASQLVTAGEPVEFSSYDKEDETIVFAYDPIQTPDPKIELISGENAGDRVLLMNGAAVVQFSNASTLKLSDINVIEVALAA